MTLQLENKIVTYTEIKRYIKNSLSQYYQALSITSLKTDFSVFRPTYLYL